MNTLGELLHGSDEDFLTNLYLAVLGRWPDEGGFAQHLQALVADPGRRAKTFREFVESEEGRSRPGAVDPDPGPVSAERALAAQLGLRTQALRREVIQLREAQATASAGAAVLGEVGALSAALASLGTELRERMAALEAALAGRVSSAPNLSPAISLDYVNDQIEAAQMALNQRLRVIEKRLLARD